MSHPSYKTRTTWSNHLGNQSTDPLRIYSPQSIDEVVAIVRAAEQAGVGARAVGSGHSWSDVALTDGFLMRTHRLARARARARLPAPRLGDARAGSRRGRHPDQGAQRVPRRQRPGPAADGRL